MGVLSWFSRTSPPDYETLLSRLATDINDAKIHLSEIRLRERRISLLVYAYGIGLWAVWVGLWWVGGLPWGLVGVDPRSVEARIIGAASVSGGPVFIWLLSRLLHIFFTRQRNAEETHLRRLLAEQRKHLDAVKKATNYDSTRKLIEQYEGGSAPGTPLGPGMQRPGSGPSTPQRGSQTPQTPQQGSPAKGQTPQQQPPAPTGTPRVPGHLVGIGGTPLPAGMSAEQAAAIHMQMSAAQSVLPTPEKKWYDRVVDSILGDDPSQAAQSKYALVCGECFRHNGLVGSKSEWERMQWICPRCNHMNLPPISRQQGATGLETKAAASNPTLPSPVTPTPPAAVSPSPLMRRNAPVTRRSAAERGTPRSSKLGKEVFTASESDHDDEGMDVDETAET